MAAGQPIGTEIQQVPDNMGVSRQSRAPPASAGGMPRTCTENARTFSEAGENTTAYIPVITPWP
jgi:hypothetical protein